MSEVFTREQIVRAWAEASIYDSCYMSMWDPKALEDFLQALTRPQFPDGKLPVPSTVDPAAFLAMVGAPAAPPKAGFGTDLP